ncbi:hypothetical protein ABWH91_11755 [Phycisphaerales bacterium ac7]
MAFACRFVCIIFLAAFAPLAGAGTSVSVSIDPQIAGGPVTGRIVVYLISEADAAESRRLQRASPASGPFFSDPQPMYGFDVTDLVPGIDVLLTDRATSFPVVWSNLPAGTYRARRCSTGFGWIRAGVASPAICRATSSRSKWGARRTGRTGWC